MIIKALVENTTISKDYECVHGLSLYIETDKHKLLFDLGPGKLFLNNAVKMGVKIDEIDTVIISHGHNDHGGALKTFLEMNKKAKIYLNEAAFEPYYSSLLGIKVYIGLDKQLKDHNRIVLTKDSFVIDDELQLFSHITQHKYIPEVNNKLYKKEGKHYVLDTFEHEQSLLIREMGDCTLIAGCAHNGIVNILDKAEIINQGAIKTVIGGFHLYNLSDKKEKHMDYLKELAGVLKARQTSYFTCHCTGQKPYEVLHKEMGNQMKYISTGMELEL